MVLTLLRLSLEDRWILVRRRSVLGSMLRRAQTPTFRLAAASNLSAQLTAKLDSQLHEDSCKQITDVARTTSAKTMGPVPIKKRIYCVLKSPHVHKDASLTFLPRLMWKSSSEKALLQL
ncbi:hypothetical protein TEA_027489 [Camellia sinensis var. sinensis]|uniref:Small ribosomal subunit protein uS10 domain-containing protein n=1 Tax=Camellia sinensis var. sinensis TaxID=542762 RepID=A0A4S4EZ32_CAMSN|nr:hypothetical protein TEA_027489 [Camellia sinensis var. sinensis]